MKRSHLPLNALRAFEAAGRHQSFKKAADELSVSDAAVSRQVRDLEARLGARLFERDHRRVRLTEPGNALLERLTASFDALDAAMTIFVTGPSNDIVSVSVEPTFATLFLMPRLAKFAQLYPEIEVQFESSASLVDLGAGSSRLAIRHSIRQSSWPRSQAQRLIGNVLTPMVAGRNRPVKPQIPIDLSGIRLLRDEDNEAWMRWLEAAGIKGTPIWGPIFSNAAITLQGAELGQGMALGNRILAADLLANETLHAPFDVDLPNGAYWLVAADFRSLSRAETLFCDWLRSEITQSAPQPATHGSDLTA